MPILSTVIVLYYCSDSNHDPRLTVGTDYSTEFSWKFQDYDMDTVLGDNDNASPGNDTEGNNNNNFESPTSSIHKGHSVQQIQALEA